MSPDPTPTPPTPAANSVAAGVIYAAQATVPFLVAIHVVDWDGPTTGLFVVAWAAIVTLAGRIFQRKAAS